MTDHSAPNRSQAALEDSHYQKIQAALDRTADGGVVEILGPDDLDRERNMETIPWSRERIDGLAAEFGKDSLDGIVLIDQLGRLAEPAQLFEQAQACLRPGGRIVMIEPGLSLLSWPFYYFFGDRRVDLSHPPLDNQAARYGQPGNLATASHLFNFLEHRIDLMERFPGLHCRHQEWLSILSGPLARGIGGIGLLPEGCLHPLLALENALMPFIGRWSASRLFIVLEKRRTAG